MTFQTQIKSFFKLKATPKIIYFFVSLFRLGHVLEGGPVARHELRQLVDDVADLGVGRRRGRRGGPGVHHFPGNMNTFFRETLFALLGLFVWRCTQQLQAAGIAQVDDSDVQNLEFK